MEEAFDEQCIKNLNNQLVVPSLPATVLRINKDTSSIGQFWHRHHTTITNSMPKRT